MSKVADEQTRRSSGPGPAQVRLSSQARSELRELMMRASEISGADTGDKKDMTFKVWTECSGYDVLLGEKTMGVGEFVALLGDLSSVIHQIGSRENKRLDNRRFDVTEDHHLGEKDSKTLTNCRASLAMDFDEFVARMGTDRGMIEEFALMPVRSVRHA
jgi:hypothetical protein